MKQLLDQEFPLPDYTAEGILRGAVSLGDAAKARAIANLSVLSHVRKVIEADAAKLCCMPLGAHPMPLDYVDLLESIGTDNLLRRARLLTTRQGLPERALEFLAEIESAYKEHPQVALARGQAELQAAERADGPSKEGLSRSAYVNAVNAMYWEQGQTPNAADAFDLIGQTRRGDYGVMSNFYSSDVPFRAFYTDWQGSGDSEGTTAYLHVALRNATIEFEPVRNLFWAVGELPRRWDKAEEVVKSIDGRFAGHPGRALLMAKITQRKGDVRAAERHYRENIGAGPAGWGSYSALGTLLFEEGQRGKAFEVFASYPGFRKDSTENRVTLSNHALDAGSMFFWSGDFAHAIPLYRVSADLRTGSHASMTSDIRLRLIERDYARAMAGTLERVKRYRSSPFASRDYLGFLFATGQSKDAWDAFNVLVGQIDKPQIWEAPLVGHGIAGSSESEIAAWAAQDSIQKAGREFPYAAMYLVRAGVTDRMPSKDLALRVAGIDRPVWKVHGEYTHVVRSSTDGKFQRILGPDAPDDSSLPLGVFDGSKKIQVKSDLAYFVEAYMAIRAGDFVSARTRLQEASTLFDFSNPSRGHMLPYYAFAAAKSGDLSAVGKFLDGVAIDHQRFDYFLAKAVVSGITGNASDSIRFLTLALHRRPFTEIRPIYTEYQFAEICEWLYDATRNEKYRAIALDWARKNQINQPWVAWAYAVEAKLSRNAADRGRAIAMAYYLDKRSERLMAIPKSEIDAAVKEFGSRNPLRLNERFRVREAA